jgi:hypothetical protein
VILPDTITAAAAGESHTLALSCESRVCVCLCVCVCVRVRVRACVCVCDLRAHACACRAALVPPGGARLLTQLVLPLRALLPPQPLARCGRPAPTGTDSWASGPSRASRTQSSAL